jgi:hypothetical protein
VLLAPEPGCGPVPSLAPGNVDELGWCTGSAGVPVVPPVEVGAGVVPGVAPLPLTGGGGPASGVFAGAGGGIFVVLIESAGVSLSGFPGVVGGVTVSVGVCGAGGVTSFLSVALAPNGLRESSELCASTLSDHPDHDGG